MKTNNMKILFLAPLTRKITPDSTAGRTSIVFNLVTELKKRGHEITLLGTGDSNIPGVKIVPVIKKGFYEISSSFENPFYAHTSFLVKQAKMAKNLSSKFDLIHNHSYPEFISLLALEDTKTPIVTTLHMTLTPELDQALSFFLKNKIVGSRVAKKLAKKTKIHKVIHHGINTDLFTFEKEKEDYLLWIGRLSKAKDNHGNFMDPKGVRWAIKLAEETNSKLLMGGAVEDLDFFKKDVKPHLTDRIKWVTSISFEQPLKRKEVAELMKKARTFLMMSEIFGLTVIEAQSCGTPVIGFKREVPSALIIDGSTGFVVEKNIKALKKALNNIDKIKPENCRKHVEENFSQKKMVEDYEDLYRELSKNK